MSKKALRITWNGTGNCSVNYVYLLTYLGFGQIDSRRLVKIRHFEKNDCSFISPLYLRNESK